ncbi:MAG: YpdA family putative bacillithiol disulfide reductase [Bacteroidia bacterium]|nr:YpdA family putative bacillithiol disulfide reductase [Bacteroidia bacterium]
MKKYDLIIIGGGPIGLAAGIEARKKNLSFLILEKGCLVNSIYHYPTNMTFFSTSQKIEIGGVPFVSHTVKPTRREALEYYRRISQSFELPVHTYEPVSGFEAKNGGYLVHTDKETYPCAAIVIATGFYDHPNLMGIPGEDLPKVKHYYDDAHPYAGRKVLVVGAANSAIDAALETWRAGAEVTLVHHGPEISHRVKYWVKPDIDNRIAEGSIKAYFNTRLIEVRPQEIDLETPEGRVTLPNDFVLAMTGYQPDFSWLTRNGIELCDDELRLPARNEETFESNLPNVFLAGTVCGGMNTNKWFIENSIEHASIVIQEIANRK